MTTSAAEGTDTFGGTTVNEYSQMYIFRQPMADAPNTKAFRILEKDVRGLKTDERIQELLIELKTL